VKQSNPDENPCPRGAFFLKGGDNQYVRKIGTMFNENIILPY
jgi:hypothetical protein